MKCVGKHERPVHLNLGRHRHVWFCLACGKQIAGPKMDLSDNDLKLLGEALKLMTGEQPKENAMETGLQITFTAKPGATNKDIAQALRFHAGLIEGLAPKEAASNENTKAVLSKKGKAPPVQEEQFDLGEQTGGEELVDEDPLGIGGEEEKAPEITKEAVIKALQAYVKKNDRDKAIAIVKKFAKSGAVKDLTPDQYPKVMKALGA